MAEGFDEYGREICDPRPIEWPAGMKRPETMQETMRRLIATELSQAAEAAGAESFEDADDFEVEDEDPEMVTQHELAAMELELPFGAVDADQEALDASGGGSRQGGSPPAPTGSQKPSGEAGGASNAPPSTLQSTAGGRSEAMQSESPKESKA